jgi:hypothetical protein
MNPESWIIRIRFRFTTNIGHKNTNMNINLRMNRITNFQLIFMNIYDFSSVLVEKRTPSLPRFTLRYQVDFEQW